MEFATHCSLTLTNSRNIWMSSSLTPLHGVPPGMSPREQPSQIEESWVLVKDIVVEVLP